MFPTVYQGREENNKCNLGKGKVTGISTLYFYMEFLWLKIWAPLGQLWNNCTPVIFCLKWKSYLFFLYFWDYFWNASSSHRYSMEHAAFTWKHFIQSDLFAENKVSSVSPVGQNCVFSDRSLKNYNHLPLAISLSCPLKWWEFGAHCFGVFCQK